MKLNHTPQDIDAMMLKSVMEQIEKANIEVEEALMMESELQVGSVVEIEITEEDTSYLALNDLGQWYWKRPDAA